MDLMEKNQDVPENSQHWGRRYVSEAMINPPA